MKTKENPRGKTAVPWDPATTPVGVVGLGVMGAVVATSMLAAGHPVSSVALEDSERRTAKRRVRKHLTALHKAGQLAEAPDEALRRLLVSAEYSVLAPCRLVVESIIEELDAKRIVIQRIEEVVGNKTFIGSNTSALPITEIQRGAKVPKRILGLHWVSSSPFIMGIEVMGGEETAAKATKSVSELVRLWGKIPIVSRRDTPGFLCNRMFYAMLREAFALLEDGAATPREIDDALRTSMGTWLPHVGPFAYLDLTGPAAYANIMRDLFPQLCCAQAIPKSLQKLVDSDGHGVANGRGFYSYAPGEGELKREQFDEFRRDLTALIKKYESTSQPKQTKKPK